MFCTKCGVANRENANFCKACAAPLNLGVIAQPSPQTLVINATKSPGLAAVLSFFICGLGQIYNGQILKGIFMIVIYGLSVALTFVLIGLITTPILWIFGMVDAYRTAERFNLKLIGDRVF